MNLDSEFSFLPFLRMLITVPKVCVCIVLNEMYRRNSEPKCLPPSALLQLIGLLTFKPERNLVKIDVNEQIKWETEEMRLFQDMKMKLLNVVSIFVIVLTPIIFRYIPALNTWNQNCATPIKIAQFRGVHNNLYWEYCEMACSNASNCIPSSHSISYCATLQTCPLEVIICILYVHFAMFSKMRCYWKLWIRTQQQKIASLLAEVRNCDDSEELHKTIDNLALALPPSSLFLRYL